MQKRFSLTIKMPSPTTKCLSKTPEKWKYLFFSYNSFEDPFERRLEDKIEK